MTTGTACHRTGLLFTCLLLLACAPHATGGAGLEFAELGVQPDRMPPGAALELTLTNRSVHPLGYNLCPSVIERRVGDDWQLHPEPLAEACTMELRTLAPGASGSFRHTLPAALPPGRYRFRTGVEWPLGESWVGVISSTFEVTQ
jgi:hypothetical protein